MQIDTLQAELKELRDRLGKDSHNSSKPPSSDGLAKKPVSLRPQTGRKPGGQKGHLGKIMALTDTPDEIVLHAPDQGACCGLALAEAQAETGERRQVLDLPPLRRQVGQMESGSAAIEARMRKMEKTLALLASPGQRVAVRQAKNLSARHKSLARR